MIQPKPLSPKLLEAIVCPISKRPLRYNRYNNELISDEAKVAFPIENDVPILTIKKARKIKS